jgi:Resolvase, N terminal domain
MTEIDPQTRRLGYARVSTYGQTLDAQLDQLRADGCAKLYREKASGAQADRRELLKLLKNIIPGDVVTVTRIDRLARSTFDLFAIVKRIVDAGGQFRSLAEPWADTATSTGRLMIAVLGGLADVERDLIRTRTAEGRSRARARGQHMGRTPSPHPATAEGSPPAPCGGRDVERPCPLLQRQYGHNFEAHVTLHRIDAARSAMNPIEQRYAGNGRPWSRMPER